MNGLFWGYHWLQGSMDDLLYRVAPEDQLASYEVMGAGITGWSCIGPIGPFMPMFAEVSPRLRPASRHRQCL